MPDVIWCIIISISVLSDHTLGIGGGVFFTKGERNNYRYPRISWYITIKLERYHEQSSTDGMSSAAHWASAL